jgi:hypothetical protein
MRLTFALTAVLAAASAASATSIVIAPDESTSKDTFVYSAIPSGLPFGNATYLGASLESSGVHTVASLIQFDVTGVTMNAGDKATLSVYARSKAGTPFSSVASDPSPTAPVIVDVLRVIGPWDEATTTWSTIPGALGAFSEEQSFTVTELDRYYTVDITQFVSSWIGTPADNFGILLKQRSVVPVAGAPDAAAVFQSSGAANRPTLTITQVPEPMSLAGLGFVTMLTGRRRK